MATGAFGTANAVTTTTAATFIPEMWSDEIIAAYKRSLVMAALVRSMAVDGRKGDTLNIPSPIRGAAARKLANTVVTIQQNTEQNIAILLDQHYEYSRVIEDIVSVQALDSLRQFYTDDAGYALSLQVDTDLLQLGRVLNNGAGTAAYAAAYIGGDGATLYTGANQSALTSAGIRRLIQRLDDNAQPMEGRKLVLPPVARNVLMGIAEYTAHQYVGEGGSSNVIRNGKIGDLYGIPVHVTPNCETATGGARIGLIFHKDALVLVEQMAPRTQTQYKQEYLGDLFTADMLYGVKCVRSGAVTGILTGGYAIAIPA